MVGLAARMAHDLVITELATHLQGQLVAVNPAYAEMTPYEIFIDQIKATMPLGRPQTPEDIGKTVAFLASDDASEITGQATNVNGGAAFD